MDKRKAGFTLIELLVVISIIALLLSILMPALSRAKDLAKRAVCANDLKQIGIAVSAYEGKYSGLMPNTRGAAVATDPSGNAGSDAGSVAGDLPNTFNDKGSQETHPYVCYRHDKVEHFYGGDSDKMIPYRLACLYEARLIDNAKVFYCPGNRDKNRKYESYMNPAPWGTLPQQYNEDTGSNDWVRAGYEWFTVEKGPKYNNRTVSVDGVPFPVPPQKLCTKYEKLDPALAYCMDVIRTRDWLSHRYGRVAGVNLLYSDGHVAFCSDQAIFRLKTWDVDPSGREGIEINAIYYGHILEFGMQ